MSTSSESRRTSCATPAGSTIRTTTIPTEMIQAMRTDPALFVQWILQDLTGAYRPLARVHAELQNHLSRHDRALVEMPRDHGKTTQVCLRVGEVAPSIGSHVIMWRPRGIDFESTGGFDAVREQRFGVTL